MSSSQLTLIFFRGVQTTNQIDNETHSCTWWRFNLFGLSSTSALDSWDFPARGDPTSTSPGSEASKWLWVQTSRIVAKESEEFFTIQNWDLKHHKLEFSMILPCNIQKRIVLQAFSVRFWSISCYFPPFSVNFSISVGQNVLNLRLSSLWRKAHFHEFLEPTKKTRVTTWPFGTASPCLWTFGVEHLPEDPPNVPGVEGYLHHLSSVLADGPGAQWVFVGISPERVTAAGPWNTRDANLPSCLRPRYGFCSPKIDSYSSQPIRIV